MRENMWIFSFWDLVTSILYIQSLSIFLQNLPFYFSLELNSTPFVYVPDFHYLFICWWTTKFILVSCSCKQSSNKNGFVNISTVEYEVLLVYIPRSEITESYGNSIFNFLETLQTNFLSTTCVNFYSPQKWVRGSSFFTFSPFLSSVCCL